MALEISVGPPVLTIHQNSTFMVTDLNGEITGEGELGVFASDTRFLSYYAISANGEPWTRLTSSATAYDRARIHLTNRPLATEEGDVAGGTLALTITRVVDEGIHEDLDVTNYSLDPVRFHLEIALRSDFADLFEVKEHEFVRRGHIRTEWSDERGELHTFYTNRDFRRRFTFHPFKSDSRPHYANGRISFPIELAPGASWHACCEYVLAHDEQVRAPAHEHDERTDGADELQRRWLSAATTLTSANEDVYRLYRTSVEDMLAMRLRDFDSADDVWLPAAGVPWFVTIFGRDSLIVGLQTMMVHPCLGLGALKNLARLQATERDDWRDAEPGKIPHELRSGELAHFKRIPHTPYYGTADATPLYLIALHEAWKWLGDTSLLREYRDVAVRCLEWIDRDGDLDGDGFQEYRTRSSRGYENMGGVRGKRTFGVRTSASMPSASTRTSGRSRRLSRTRATVSGAASPNRRTPPAWCNGYSSRTCGAAGASGRSRRRIPPTTPSRISLAPCGRTTTASSLSVSSVTALPPRPPASPATSPGRPATS